MCVGALAGDCGNFMKHRKNDLFKKFLILCIDVALIVISMFFAYIITTESAPNPDYLSILIWFLGNIALVVFIYKCSGLYSIIFSSASIIDALRLCFAIFCILVANIIYVAIIGRGDLAAAPSLYRRQGPHADALGRFDGGEGIAYLRFYAAHDSASFSFFLPLAIQEYTVLTGTPSSSAISGAVHCSQRDRYTAVLGGSGRSWTARIAAR